MLEKKGVDANVGLISHIGGHKFAGNVIVYLPPASAPASASGVVGSGSDLDPDIDSNSLAGTGIWYGRVGPEHVEGVIEETIVKGRIIQDLFRGGVGRGGVNLGRLLEEQIKRDQGDDEGSLRLKPRARAGVGGAAA